MIRVTVRLRGAELLTQSKINAAMRRAMYSLGVKHKTLHLPKHFTKGGAREYGYKPRKGESSLHKGSYTYRKLRKFSHTLPLVYTGELRREALFGTRKIRVTSTSKEATVHIGLPSKANWKNPHSQIDMLAELRAVSEAELAQMEFWLTEYVEAELRKEGADRASAGVQLANV